MNKFQRILLFLFLVLAGIGMEFELGSLSQEEFSQVAGRDLVLNLLVLAVIVVPLYLFIKGLAKRFEVPLLVLWATMFGGAFVAGWLSFSGNSLIDHFNSHLIQDVSTFWILLILGRKDLKSILIAGFGSGLGFQIIEDLGYVARQTRSGDLSAVTEAVNRISGGLASHAVYTAVVSVGAFLILSQCTKQKEKLFGLWCVVSTVANHFLWNSPFYETDHRVNILVGLLFAFQVGTFIEVVLLAHKNPNLTLLKKN